MAGIFENLRFSSFMQHTVAYQPPRLSRKFQWQQSVRLPIVERLPTRNDNLGKYALVRTCIAPIGAK
jgi:hypothetical protein